MTWKCVRLAVFGACVALISTRAFAQGDFARNGAYVGIAGTFAHYTKAEDSLPGNADVDDPLGLNARVGYRFHPHVAAELEFEWLSEADVDVFGSNVGTLETWTLMVNGKAYLLTGQVQPYALMGLGWMRARADFNGGGSNEGDDVGARFGAGFDVYATQNILVNLGVTYVVPTGATGDINDTDYVSFGWGFGYRF